MPIAAASPISPTHTATLAVGPDAGNEEAGETGGGPGGAARVSEFMQKGYTSFLFLNIE
jgi:hypothetical protein